MPSEHLNAAERQVIQRAREAGQAYSAIARTLGRNPSSISREWRRNSCSGRYNADEAQQRAELRATKPRHQARYDNRCLRSVVLSGLEREWSPEIISARLHVDYPKAGNGRKPYALPSMLRIHFLQHWFNYADEAMEEALYEVPLLSRFAGIDLGEDTIPDAGTILNFRDLLERHELADVLFEEVQRLLHERGLLLRRGTIVDATLIQAPPSTKNRDRKRGPDMSQTKKANQWHFGMKAHIGVDADSGLVHTVLGTTAKTADCSVLDELLHGEEREVLGDKAYTSNERNLSASDPKRGPIWGFPYKKPKGKELWRHMNMSCSGTWRMAIFSHSSVISYEKVELRDFR